MLFARRDEFLKCARGGLRIEMIARDLVDDPEIFRRDVQRKRLVAIDENFVELAEDFRPGEIQRLRAVQLHVLVHRRSQRGQAGLLNRRGLEVVQELGCDVGILALGADVIVFAETVEARGAWKGKDSESGKTVRVLKLADKPVAFE